MHNVYGPILGYARPFSRGLLGILVLTLLSHVFALLQPWPLQWLFDYVLGDQPVPGWVQRMLPETAIDLQHAMLIAAVLGGLLVFLLTNLTEAGMALTTLAVSKKMSFGLGAALFNHLQRHSLRYHNRHTVGDSVTRIAADSWSVFGVTKQILLTPIPSLLTIGLMAWIMVKVDVWLTIAVLSAAPFMAAASFFFGKPIRRIARQRQKQVGHVQAQVQQSLSGIQVVQAFAQELREQEKFRNHTDLLIEARQKAALFKNIAAMSTGIFGSIATAIVLYIGANRVLDKSLTLGELVVFLAYLNTIRARMVALSQCYTGLQSNRGQVERVLEVLESEPDVQERPDAEPLPKVHGDVRFEGVTFGYEAGRPVLHGIDLEVRRGQTMAIVGATGAGKSTLVSLIPRFFDPWEGQVTVDGKDLRDVRLRDLRRQVAVVLQDPFLFPMSVAENIAYGRPEAGRDQIEAAARAANAHDFIMRLQSGYDTVIGERGGTLSGGERQRVSIARALVTDAPILILDEPTSAVDTETERLVVQALRRLMAGRTTFIIAHRLSTVRHADRIVVLETGRIAEAGTHDELIAHGGIYAHLCGLLRSDVAPANTSEEA